jgi:AraC-like DNA-binding protein
MLDAGFSTKSNFNKEFQRVTGVSPSEYRKQIKEQ